MASAGRPRNSNDFASSSQSSAEPPPLARRDSKLVTALSIELAAGFGAPLSPLADSPLSPLRDAPLAASNARTASVNPPGLPDELVAVGEGSGRVCRSDRYAAKTHSASTHTIGAPIQRRVNSVFKRGNVRNNGSSTTRTASVAQLPVSSQNKGIAATCQVKEIPAESRLLEVRALY